MTDFLISPLAAEDIPAAAALEAECFSRPWSEKTLAGEFALENTRFFGAFYQGRLVGYAGLRFAADEGEIFNIAVERGFRGRGVGRALAEKLAAAALELGLSCLLLEVRPSNKAALGLYIKAGFAQYALRKNYYSAPTEDAVLMRLEL